MERPFVKLLPIVLSVLLAALGWIYRSDAAAGTIPASLYIAAALIALWWLILRARSVPLDTTVQLRKQHYVQASAQAAVFVYWGMYWPEVGPQAALIGAQILFAYAFDMLLAWTLGRGERRGEPRARTYVLGFGPVPVIFSINLFLWFRPEWFHWQLAMVAVGLLAKDLVRWQRDGRRVHIFNPSSFPLGMASIALLAAGATGMTFGPEIATTQFYPPQMFLMLFLVSLPGQYLFGVSSMTLPAVASAWLFSRIYFGVTGICFFYDSYIPIAVFLGMHLLFNDPSTSPRTELGRVIYGVLYGLGVVGLYQLLGSAGLPTFYDKLLPVPLLNLSVKALDRVGHAWPESWILGKLVPAGSAMMPDNRRRLAYAVAWVVVFAGLGTAGGLNDDHPGQWLPFWQQACDEGRPYACPYLADLDQLYCDQGSGYGCNEAGLMYVVLSRTGEDLRRTSITGAVAPFRRGCELGFAAACENLEVLETGKGGLAAAPPELSDWPILLRGSKGEITERDPGRLYAMACERGWREMCSHPPAQ